VRDEPPGVSIDAPLPVLIPDTCALLDLVRVTDRAQSVDGVADTLQPALDILRRAEKSPPSVAVVVPQYVHEEYERNIQKVRDTVASRWAKVVQQLAFAHQAAETLGVAPRPPEHGHDAFEPTLEACERLPNRIRRVGTTLERTTVACCARQLETGDATRHRCEVTSSPIARSSSVQWNTHATRPRRVA
jgi:hypothetical protein